MRTKETYRKILEARERKNQGLLHASLEMQTSTHFPLLMRAVRASKGTVAEFGSGLFSTPLLHWLCEDEKRPLISYESYRHYYDFAKLFASETHEVRFVKDWDALELEPHYGVVLIDHTIPGRKHTRGDDAIRLAHIADYVVLHDAGQGSHDKYGYEEAYKHFRYRKDWTGCRPHTTVLSNRFDVYHL